MALIHTEWLMFIFWIFIHILNMLQFNELASQIATAAHLQFKYTEIWTILFSNQFKCRPESFKLQSFSWNLHEISFDFAREKLLNSSSSTLTMCQRIRFFFSRERFHLFFVCSHCQIVV